MCARGGADRCVVSARLPHPFLLTLPLAPSQARPVSPSRDAFIRLRADHYGAVPLRNSPTQTPTSTNLSLAFRAARRRLTSEEPDADARDARVRGLNTHGEMNWE